MFPRRMPSRGPSLRESDLEKVVETLMTMTGWMGEVARFYIGTLAYTGLRPGELRKAQLEDLDLSNWTLRVSHPKGESSYGRNRQVPIPALLRPIVLQYLQARDRMLAEQGIAGATSLVCTMKGTTYSSK
jgi:integrase